MFEVSKTRLDREAKARLVVLKKQFPFYFFVPNQPQYDLSAAVGNLLPRKRIFLVTSGNGAGKTSGVVNILLNIIYQRKNVFRNIKNNDGSVLPSFYPGKIYEHWPTNWPKTIWYVSNKDSIESIWLEWKKWLPQGYFEEKSHGKSYSQEITFKDSDWQMTFKTIDQEDSAFESASVGIVIFDEPPPRSIMKACMSRLRLGGFVMIPATPLLSASYFQDEIIDRVTADSDKYHQTVSMWSNCIEECGTWDLGKYGIQYKGALHRDNINFMIQNFDPDEIEARVHGRLQSLTGVVYKSFKPEIHVVSHDAPRDPNIYRYQFIIDPHERRPPFCAWIRIGPDNRKHIIAEWPDANETMFGQQMYHDIKNTGSYVIDDYVKRICEVEREILKFDMDRLTSIMDPLAAKRKNDVTGYFLHQEYSKAFTKHRRPRGFITNVNNDIMSGHAMVKEWLAMDRGQPRMTIDGDCRNIIWSFRNYKYLPELTGKPGMNKEIVVRVSEVGKDAVDTVRYGCMVPCAWDAPKSVANESGDYGTYHVMGAKTVKRGAGADFV